ncbi:MAG: c-type cytochrome [Flavobacteriales bacterium]|nr:c-type cytochrome [Flavobacteriales bacterium]
MLNKHLSFIVVVALGLLITSCGKDKSRESYNLVARKLITGDVTKGEEIFKTNCTACHQADGKGKAGFAPNINNIDFLSIADDELVKQFILEGRAGTAMTAYKNMPHVADNINDLVAYIRSWEKNYELMEPVSLNHEWKSNGNAANGKELFKEFCAYCHGKHGEGYSSGGAGTGIGNPNFLRLVPDDYIKQTLIIGRNGTAMKSFAGAKGVAHLTDSDMNDIISYLRGLE